MLVVHIVWLLPRCDDRYVEQDDWVVHDVLGVVQDVLGVVADELTAVAAVNGGIGAIVV